MGKRKRKVKSKVDMTSFLFIQEKKSDTKREDITKTSGEIFSQDNSVESQLIDFIRDQGKIGKSKVYKWSKENKIAPVSLYKALISLEKRGLIKKEFDENIGELVYIAI